MPSETESTYNESKYRVPALEKGLDILEVLARSLVPMSMADLARDLQRGRNELFRMLICLQERDYIVKDEVTGDFTLSLKMYQLSHRHSAIKRLLTHAVPYMHELVEQIGECCHIAVIDQGALVVLEQVLSPEIFNLAIRIGSQQSIIGTPSGRLLLAHMPAAQRAVVLGSDKEYQALSLLEQAVLQDTFKIILELGYSYEEKNRVGGRSISVLVGNPEVGITASLAVPMLMIPGAKKDLAPMIARMKACADAITYSLGLDVPA